MKTWRVVAIAAVVSALAFSASAEPRHGRGDGWRGGGGHSHWGHGPYRGPRYDPGTAFWGGVVGGVLGQIFRPEPPPVIVESPPVIVQSFPERTIEWCISRYKSYNPETGIYIGFDGEAHRCP